MAFSLLRFALLALALQQSLGVPVIHRKHRPSVRELRRPRHFDLGRVGAAAPLREKTDPGFRLPKDVVPIEYDLKLKPYLQDPDASKAFSFDGELALRIKVIRSGVRRITLHSVNLTLDSTPTITPGNPRVTVSPLDKYQFLELNLDAPLTLDAEYTIAFKFRGKMRDDNYGFYKSSYQDGDVTKWLGATQFGSDHARKVFPCFDEPGLKAIFKLTMDCPAGLTCVSNMKEKQRDGSTIVFHESPRMPTYLLAFLVSEFEKNAIAGSADYGIWTRPEFKSMTTFALEESVDILAELERYMGITYFDMHHDPGVRMKLDQVGVPDFGPGAMENWGLINYKEAYMTYDPELSTTKNLEDLIAVMSHEITHMWFGDLVTCAWWSEIFLNEGFARFFEYMITDEMYPGLRMDRQIVIDQVHGALFDDASQNSLPLTNNEVNSPDEVGEQFGLAYNKGSSIVRMMEFIIGTQTFKKGLNYYLKNKTYEAATAEDLFRGLQRAADESGSISEYGFTVREIFSSWTLKSGYPVVQVSFDRNDRMTVLRQQRYFAGSGTSRDMYMIPITYASASRPSFNANKPDFIMHNETRKVNTGTYDDWVLFNVQQEGFYRVRYSDEIYGYIKRALADDAKRRAIHELNRAMLIDDAFNFAFDDKMYYDEVLDIVQFLQDDTDYSPWAAATAEFTSLRGSFATFGTLSSKFDMHITNLMKKVIADLTFDIGAQDTELRKKFRVKIMELACAAGESTCVSKSSAMFDGWVSDSNNRIPPDHRTYVYCTGLRSGPATHFDKLWTKYLQEKLVSEKITILDTLGCTKSDAKIREYLEHTLDPSGTIRLQEKYDAFNSALRGNRENVAVVYDHFTRNINRYRDIYGQEEFNYLLRSLARPMSSSQLSTYRSFLQGSSVSSAEREIGLKAISSKEGELDWVKDIEREILDWIDNHYRP